MIHPTAIIDPKANVDPSTEVGPYAIIDGNVTVGANCVVGPHVHLTGLTTIGANNTFHTGCVIGDKPQDLKYRNEPTRLRIGDDNTFREHATIHRSNSLEEDTIIGSGNYLMANAHIGHNSCVGNRVIIANGALVAGHVTIMDGAIISGNCLIHQFTRIGTMAMMQGGAGIGMDLPPFTIAADVNALGGLNVVGLRRAGVDQERRKELKRLYHLLFRSGRNLREAADDARSTFNCPESVAILDFIASSKRGVITHQARS